MTDASDHLRKVQRQAGLPDEASLAKWEKKGTLYRRKGGSVVQSVRFSLPEINAIRERAEMAGMTTSAFIRACLQRPQTVTASTFLSTNAMRSWGNLNESWTA